MDINFELYRVFYLVAKNKSISNAAKELYISQPAVSQSIKQLEEKLGGQLFIRAPKGIILTAEGEILFKYIEQAYNFIMTAENKFTEMQNLVNGEIRIGASDTLCKYYLLPYLKEFHEDYPDIRMQVTNRTSPDTIKLLKSGQVDFGFINLPIEDDSQLLVKKSMAIQDCFVAGSKYSHLTDGKISIRQLKEYPILMLEGNSSTRRFIDKYAEVQGVHIVPEIELGSLDLLVEFAKAGLGISCVIRNFVDDEISKSLLYEIQLEEVIPERNIGIVALKDVPLSAAAKRFIEYLK